MKSVLLFLYLVVLSSCASASKTPENKPFTSFYLSPNFIVKLESKRLNNAKILPNEGILIKFDNESYMSGLIIKNGEDSLPAGHDIRKFPRYRFGLDSLNTLPNKFQKMFEGSLSELNYSLNNPEIITYSDDARIYYHACSEVECESYVVKKEVEGEILALFSKGLDLKFMKSVTKGVK